MQVTTIDQFDVAAIALEDARTNLVGGAKKTGHLISSYAAALCTMFDVRNFDTGERITAWYELKGKDKAGIKAERAKFAECMGKEGFGKGTIDVYWQRVKESSGYVTTGNRVSGAVSIDDKTTAELKTILNRIFKAEEASDSTCEKSSEIKGQLLELFEFMGGDVDTIG